jgi:hypothetical protein
MIPNPVNYSYLKLLHTAPPLHRSTALPLQEMTTTPPLQEMTTAARITWALDIESRVIGDDDDVCSFSPMKDVDGPSIDDVLLENLVLAFIEKFTINSSKDVDDNILAGVDGGLLEEKKTILATLLLAIKTKLEAGRAVRILPSNARIPSEPMMLKRLTTLIGYINVPLIHEEAPAGLYRTDGPVTPPLSPVSPQRVVASEDRAKLAKVNEVIAALRIDLYLSVWGPHLL